MKSRVQAGAVQPAVADGRKLDRVHQHLGLLGRGDVGDHQAGRPVFQVAVEAGLFQGRRPQHAVDVEQVEEGHQRLHFAILHVAVFQVEPHAVHAEMSGVPDE